MKKRYIYIILFSLILIIIDFMSKVFVLNNLNSEFVIINNFLSFIFVKNVGAAFGLFGGNMLLLILITLLLIIYILYEIKNNINNKLNLFCYLLILSGAIGNLIDRLYYGYVVDFISFIFFNYQMPVFNIADIFVTVGVILLVYNMCREGSI